MVVLENSKRKKYEFYYLWTSFVFYLMALYQFIILLKYSNFVGHDHFQKTLSLATKYTF
jgi:hypothetical protein